MAGRTGTAAVLGPLWPSRRALKCLITPRLRNNQHETLIIYLMSTRIISH